MWFLGDLGRPLVLDRIKVSSPRRALAVGYRIELSEDGQDWHLVAQADKNWTDLDVAFAPHRARYLRLEQTGQSYWGATGMISEIAVGTAQPWAGASASHYSDDAHLQTHWITRAARQKPDMWFDLDMGTQQQIERVTLEQCKNESPQGYVIQASTDGQQWQDVGYKNDNSYVLNAEVQSVTAR
jgi:endo-1,3(4)-beta-glucanase